MKKERETSKDVAPYHHGNLRASLLEAALTRLSEQTEETLSLRDLAKSVGVSIAAVYRHFPNKEALLAEVAIQGFREMMAQWERHLPAIGTVNARTRFHRLAEMYIAFALASPAHYRLMFVQGDLRAFPDLQAAGEACFAYVVATARAAVLEAGADEKWTMPTAQAAWSLVHGYVLLSLGGRLAKAGGQQFLPPELLPSFFNLPREALPTP